ncbi:MAG: hypothetical protein K0Q59_5195 [Paenibacillus sp.]|nr:hypothetical protein [Paenibacillus sp.]
MDRIRFAIVGGGWRSEFFLRIAQAVPERFEVAALVVRDEAKGAVISKKWDVPVFRDIASLLRETSPDFVVTSVPSAVNPEMMGELAKAGMPVLSETPPAKDTASMVALYNQLKDAKIQVAEQYPFQPLHAARIAIAQSGKLGTVSHASVSAAHGYHGICLMRKLLGVAFQQAVIQATRFTAPIIAGPGRGGGPTSEQVVSSAQVIAHFQFGDKLGVYDFTGDQYFSWIRSQRVLARGERGEINNREVRYLRDYKSPVQLELKRMNAGEEGNLEGYYHKGIMAGDEWIYRNPVAPGRLTDDEIAIADCLIRMGDYSRGGASFYGLAEGCHDQYLALLIQQSLETGAPVRSERMPWDD